MTDAAPDPHDIDAQISALVRQVDEKMEDIKETVRSISAIITERQKLEVEKKDAEGGDHA